MSINEELLEKYIEYQSQLGKNVDATKRHITRALDLLGKPVTEIKPSDIDVSFLAKCKEQGMSPGNLISLIGFMNYLSIRDDISPTRFMDVKMSYQKAISTFSQQNKRSGAMRILTKGEIKLIFGQLSLHRPGEVLDALILFMLYNAGMMSKEIIECKKEHIRGDCEAIYIPEDTAGHGAAKGPWLIRVNNESFRTVLKQWVHVVRPALTGETGDEDKLVVPTMGGRLDHKRINSRLQYLCRKAGVEGVTVELLHNSRIAHMMDDGASDEELKLYWRHRSEKKLERIKQTLSTRHIIEEGLENSDFRTLRD